MLEAQHRQRLWARALTATTLGVACSLVVFVIARRIAQPTEHEWMTGSILDHIERVSLGKPVYVAPSADWIPFLYPPGYYWVSSFVAKFVSLTWAARIVSVFATCVATTCVFLIARTLHCSRFWAGVAAALFVSCYTRVAHWFDIERCDPLLVALLAAATLISMRSKALWHSGIAGLLLAFACMTKQQAIFTVAAIVVSQLVLRNWRHAGTVTTAVVTMLGVLCIREQVRTDGWFGYYCWTMPQKHGIEAKLVTVFLVIDHAKFILFALASVASAWQAAALLRRAQLCLPLTALQQRELVFLAALLSTWCSSGLSRMHTGGYPNVLLPWLLFASIATARFASITERLVRSVPGLVWSTHGLLSLGVFASLEDPSDAIPAHGAQLAAAELTGRIRKLELHGEVLLTGRGHVTRTRHFHMAALVDVLREGTRVDSLTRDLQRKRFAAIIIDSPEELYGGGVLDHSSINSSILRDALSNYCVYQRLPDAPLPVSGFKTRPQWLLLPRAEALPVLSDAELVRQLDVEVAIATAYAQSPRSTGEDELAGVCEAQLMFDRSATLRSREVP